MYKAKKIKHLTALHDYLQDRRLSDETFASMLGVNHAAVVWWRFNYSLPSLVNAFKIERVTRGAIPAVYWIDTPKGVRIQNGTDTEGSADAEA